MKVGLIIALTIVGLFIFGPLGALGGLILGCFASVTSKVDETALERAMRKVHEEAEQRRRAGK